MPRISLGLTFALLAATASGQDITVTPFRVAPDTTAPDQAPKPGYPLQLDYPEDLKGVTEPAYVLVTYDVEATGQIAAIYAVSTHTPLERAVETARQGQFFAPALTKKTPVATRVSIAVIANPAGAAARAADATARLLDVGWIFAGDDELGGLQQRTVPLVAAIDEGGRLTGFEFADRADTGMRTQITEGLKDFRFAPARKAGQPVASSLTFTVAVTRKPPARTEFVPASIIKRAPIVYPGDLADYALPGEVEVSFTVGSKGKVINPTIARTTNPGFNLAAINAVRASTFRPATENGNPVPQSSSVVINFSPIGRTRDVFAAPADSRHLPEALRYDVPPKVRSSAFPVYPYALMREGVRGTASAMMMIDERGAVTSVILREASAPEFGRALVAALECFSFDPARRGGKPVATAMTYTHKFSADKVDAWMKRMINREKSDADSIVRVAALDKPWTTISKPKAVFPKAVPAHFDGLAVVEIIVDEKGRVWSPRVLSASKEEFGYAAVQCVAGWLYEEPKIGDKPATVRVQVPFTFTGAELKPTATK